MKITIEFQPNELRGNIMTAFADAINKMYEPKTACEEELRMESIRKMQQENFKL